MMSSEKASARGQKNDADKRLKKAQSVERRNAKKAAAKNTKQTEIAKKAAVKREKARIQAEVRAKKAQRAEERQKKRLAVYTKIRLKLKNRKSGFDYNGFGLIPRVELAVKGDRTSVVVRLSSAGISVTDISYAAGETLFKIRKKDLNKAVAILGEMCYNHRIIATYGIARKMAFVLARIGLICGAALSVIALYISYGYIWKVNIDGNSALSVATIEAELKRAGVGVGRKKSDDLTDYAADVLGRMDGISDASCEIEGTTLHVRVLESSKSTEIARYSQYVSAYDATVTRIVLKSGTALVKRGDVVRRGDALVSGDRFSTTGELLYTGECLCEVYGKVALTYTAHVPLSAVEYRRTGKTSVKTVYTLFGKQLGSSVPPYASYDVVSHTSRYDILVPLYATTYTYHETKAVEYERDIDSAAVSFAQSKIEEMSFEGEFDYKYDVKQNLPGLYTVHLFISGETVISRGR